MAENDFDATLDRMMSGQGGDTTPAAPSTTSARFGYMVGSQADPDAYAADLQIARKTGLPIQTVQAEPKIARQQAAMGDIDFDALARTSPTTAALLADVEKSKIAHDDVGNLSGIERLLNPVTSALRSMSAFPYDFAEGAYGVVQGGLAAAAPVLDPLVGTILPGNPLRGAAEGWGQTRRQAAATADQIAGDQSNLGFVQQGVNAGFRSFGQMLPGMGASLATGNPWFALGSAGLVQGGQSTGKALDAGLSPYQALAYGAQDATAEIATEMLPVGKLLKDVKVGAPFWKMVGHQAITEVPGEVAATAWQNFNEWANLHPEQTVDDYIKKLGPDEGQTVLATLTTTLLTAGLGRGASRLAQRVQRDDQKAQQADAGVQVATEMGRLASANKVLQRDPETFESFVQSAAENGPVPQVFIDANALQQSGIADQVVAASPSAAEQFQQALDTGGTVAIPTEEYASRIAGTDLNAKLLDHLRTDPDGFSRAEATQYMDTRGAQLQAEMEQTLREQQADDAFKQSADAVRANVKQQLDTAARFTPQVNDAYSSLVGNFYAVQSARLGVTPEEMFQRYPLRVVSQDIAGGEALRQSDFTPTEQAVADWQRSLTKAASNPQAKAPKIATPAVLRAMGEKSASLEFPVTYLRTVRTEHPDVPMDVYERLPELLHDPLFVIPHKEGGASVVLDARSTSGAPLVAGVRDGRVRTITPMDGDAGQTGDERVAGLVNNALGRRGNRVYARNNEALAGVRASGERSEWLPAQPGGHQDSSRAAAPGLIPMHRGSIPAASIFTKAALVRKLGEDFYQDANLPAAIDVNGQQRLTTNSAGQPIASTEEAVRVFWDWFGDSKVVDAEGRPLVVYHGTTKDFDAFDNSKTGANDMGLWGRGHYFASAPTSANSYALRQGDGARVIPVYVSIQNPLVLRTGSDLVTRLPDGTNTRKLIGQNLDGSKIKSIALDGGHDGVIQIKPDGSIGDLVAFQPEQIKSATGNNGNFDPSDPNILHQGETSARGLFDPSTSTIALLQNADLSTFLHESGHFFLEAQMDMASRIEGAQRDGASVSDGEQQILTDAQALLKWFGNGVSTLDEWHALSLEEKRSSHEQFARGFEAYLFDGKSPSIEMAGVFQRFRAWLVNVYKSLKNLNVELTPEVRGVMDRMIASTEQIQLAEQGRSMMPLFATAAEAGMTPQEFDAYQRQGIDASNDAIQELQNRGLRDMKWLNNARSKILRKLQREADAQRREVRMDVRREVMGQPVYRAWTFLTSRLGKEDQLPPETKPGTSTDIDATRDPLFTAIAKLGGLRKEDVVSQWGIDPKESFPQPVFGKPILRVNGGLAMDQMAQRLIEVGYLTPDENGKEDLQDLEDKFQAELRGEPQYSVEHDYSREGRAGDQVVNPGGLNSGRLDLAELKGMHLPDEVVTALQNRKMTSSNGLHPDIVAELHGFTSGDELARALAAAEEPKAVIEALTDVRMLEQYGDLATPAAIEQAADKAIHGEARARFITTEANALAKATGKPKVMTSAAKAYAAEIIARTKIRLLNGQQYAASEARAARASAKAVQSNDTATAAAEKRNELFNHYAARAAYDARDEVDSSLRYLRKFDREGVRKAIDPEYGAQIDAILERFDLRAMSNKDAVRRASLAKWIEAQREAGTEPDLPDDVLDEAFRKPYKELTVEEFRGVVDSVKQIEHLGRLKSKLIAIQEGRDLDAARSEIAESIQEHANGRHVSERTAAHGVAKALQTVKGFLASHVKAATWARILDGDQLGAMWRYIIEPANEHSSREATRRAEVTEKLTDIMGPVLKVWKTKPGSKTKGQGFQSIGRSLTPDQVFAMGLNMGNEGNMQRLLGGEGWTFEQVKPVLDTLEKPEWDAIQKIWDLMESFSPEVQAKYRRLNGVPLKMVEPMPVATKFGTYKGGYYPIVYDPRASQRAEEFDEAKTLQEAVNGARNAATTRRSFTKPRSDEVIGRPLLLTMDGVYRGFNEVIHDLEWHEYMIDANRLIGRGKVDDVIRSTYGADVVRQLKAWRDDIATDGVKNDVAGAEAIGFIRRNVSLAGLGFNIVNVLMQPIGITQTVTRIGAGWTARGVQRYIQNPMARTREVRAQSEFMANRFRTQLREINELRARVEGQNPVLRSMREWGYAPMVAVQSMVDVPTWIGAYERATSDGLEEKTAIHAADQAVIDSQGDGALANLSRIERGNAYSKLFTSFYAFQNTALNLLVQSGMSKRSATRKAVDMLLLTIIPTSLTVLLKAALTPGGGGDDDDDNLWKKLAAANLEFFPGLFFMGRELSGAASAAAGVGDNFGYEGPAGLRMIGDTIAFAQAVGSSLKEGEPSKGLVRTSVNLAGSATGLPAAQINRTIKGTEALSKGDTKNPAAVVFGFDASK